MNNKHLDSSRRSFLGAGAALIAASSVGVSGAIAQEKQNQSATMTGIGVSVLADALNRVGQDAMQLVMSRNVSPMVPVGRMLYGPAVTTKWQAGLGRMTADDVREFMFEPLDDAAAGSVWVVAGGTERLLSLFGGVIAVACKRNGLAGAVTDNGCRDLATFDDIGFPVFARGPVPYGPADLVRPVAANVAVICGGVSVRPGDKIAADNDGVIIVPSEVESEVLTVAAQIIAKEQKVLDNISSGVSLTDAYVL